MSEYVFVPNKEQIETSNIYRFMQKHNLKTLEELHQKSISDPAWYWNAVSEDIGIVWDKKFEKVMDSSKGVPWTNWFVNGKTNIILSTLDKFAKKTPQKVVYHFISENGDYHSLTYKVLEDEVNQLANGLKSLKISKGDVVAIYMPMIKEAIVSILACAKIGAVQTVIFSGYSADALKIRLQDCNAKILLISDGFERKGKKISQKEAINTGIKETQIQNVIIVPYKKVDDYSYSDILVNYNELIKSQSKDCKTEILDSNDKLFILYTSGTTGKPKGVVHTHGGFSVFAGHQSAYLIDNHHDDVLFWPADIGWITGIVWNVYGLLEMGATGIIYDGALDYPNTNRIWDIMSKYGATIFGISPTAVRMFKKTGIIPTELHDFKKIRLIPTTGEPIDEESWWWLFEKVGKKRIPIMNLSGGTEIGGAMLSVLPGMRLKPTTVGMPCPGIDVDVFDDKGNQVRDQKGYLVVKNAWPGMTKGLLNDDERYLKTYWSRFEEIWFHGDYVLANSDGLWYMHGRIDDVINISGHRMSTAEIEQTIMTHQKISEVASISIPDEITGEAIVVFVVPEMKFKEEKLTDEISSFVSEKIGKLAKPKFVIQLSDLPKTRTGKIMRRLLKDKLLGNQIGDNSSLENPHVLDEITPIFSKH
ncbi:MAG: AMP-dependent synthetase [Crenarchaeota archaeon]|nr:MAG: AMP-dependent synthetase [Thermoproteota archaeon]RDJ34173.1 MAG: AMP-dependent synthetase [Thermoproteota archaeon]RDJ36712.1 MAG: AMP-dependent synthetase [Thermoproteota archaeon]RDJ37755.1 MAG: AMP-dependent synthetase [Thermoproteota archaeon]